MSSNFSPLYRQIRKNYGVSAYQTNEGLPLIRCFAQEDFYIKKKQNSINFYQLTSNLGYYCYEYFDMKKQIFESIYFGLALTVIIMSRGKASPAILTTALFQSMNIEWISYAAWYYKELKSRIEKAKWAITI